MVGGLHFDQVKSLPERAVKTTELNHNLVGPHSAAEWDTIISGTYTLSGTNPISATIYSGSLAIHQSGETYSITRTVEITPFVGVGLIQGSTFAIAWKQGARFGVTAFEMQSDGTLIGPWAEYGKDL